MEIKYKNLRVLGPAVLRVKIPDKIIEKLNEYIDNTIKNKSKAEKLNYGEKLVGDVTQEFLLEIEFVKSSGWLDFLGNCSKIYTELNEGKKISKFNLSNLDLFLIVLSIYSFNFSIILFGIFTLKTAGPKTLKFLYFISMNYILVGLGWPL